MQKKEKKDLESVSDARTAVAAALVLSPMAADEDIRGRQFVNC